MNGSVRGQQDSDFIPAPAAAPATGPTAPAPGGERQAATLDVDVDAPSAVSGADWAIAFAITAAVALLGLLLRRAVRDSLVARRAPLGRAENAGWAAFAALVLTAFVAALLFVSGLAFYGWGWVIAAVALVSLAAAGFIYAKAR